MKHTLFILALAFYSQCHAQWELVPTPVSGPIFDITFINDSVSFCAGLDGVLKTADYGNTWNLVNGSPTGNNLFFINESVGYLTARTLNQLYKTTDSGMSWQLNRDFFNFTPEGVFFTSPENGHVIASIYGAPGGSSIFRTTNGGADWTLTHSYPNTPTLQAIHFIGETTGIIVGYSGRVIKTVDAGENWELIQLPQTETLFAISFPDQVTGYAVGYSNFSGSDLIKTTDEGDTWQNILTGGNSGNALRGVYFTSVNNGYAVGENGRIITTSDAGNTWSTSDSGISGTLHSAYALNETAFAVGDDGVILKNSSTLSSNNLDNRRTLLKLYPNPAHEEIRIESEAEIKDIAIIDLAGHTVKTITKGFNEIDVIDLPRGIYFFKMRMQEGTVVKKVVKQ